MSEFGDFIGDCLNEAVEAFGPVQFSIGDEDYSGDFGELGNESFSIVAGGKEVSVTSALVCPRAQFGATLPEPGLRLKIGTRRFVIGTLSSDDASVTLNLVAADAH